MKKKCPPCSPRTSAQLPPLLSVIPRRPGAAAWGIPDSPSAGRRIPAPRRQGAEGSQACNSILGCRTQVNDDRRSGGPRGRIQGYSRDGRDEGSREGREEGRDGSRGRSRTEEAWRRRSRGGGTGQIAGAMMGARIYLDGFIPALGHFTVLIFYAVQYTRRALQRQFFFCERAISSAGGGLPRDS